MLLLLLVKTALTVLMALKTGLAGDITGYLQNHCETKLSVQTIPAASHMTKHICISNNALFLCTDVLLDLSVKPTQILILQLNAY